MMSGGRGGQKVLSKPSADSFAVGRRQNNNLNKIKIFRLISSLAKSPSGLLRTKPFVFLLHHKFAEFL
jgi:hypothetical protein